MRTFTSILIVVAIGIWAGDAWAQRGGQGGRGQRGGGQRGSAVQRSGGMQGQTGGWGGQSQRGQGQQGQWQQGQGQRGRGQGQGMQGQGGQGQRGQGQRGQGRGGQQGGALTEQQAAGLVYMKQEEKLARDVYLTLGETWDLKVFDNIARAEARHMQAVGRLMSQYQVTDPMTRDVRGEFADPRLSNLYRVLVEKGLQSREAALQVGVQIEKLDISDLQTELANTNQKDIQRVYKNLLRGSQQHLRAFSSQLD